MLDGRTAIKHVCHENRFHFSKILYCSIIRHDCHVNKPSIELLTITEASFKIMRRTSERCTKVRLSFSGGPHASVNMADGMKNAGSWTVSGSKEAMEVPKSFKDLRQELGVEI